MAAMADEMSTAVTAVNEAGRSTAPKPRPGARSTRASASTPAPPGRSDARGDRARLAARRWRFREQQQLVRAPRCLLNVPAGGLSHGAALKASRQDLNRLYERRRLGLKSAHPLCKLGDAAGGRRGVR